MRRFRIRNLWNRITPLERFPRLLRRAEALFQHHAVFNMPQAYGPAVTGLHSARKNLKEAQGRKQKRRRRRTYRAALKVVLDFEREAMRSLESIAVNRGFLGISYSIAVFDSGHVWKARGWRRVGAHTLGWNDRAVAIVAVGNYEVSKPPQALQEGISRTIAKGILARRLVRGFAYRPHSDVSATACPGKFLRERMRSIRRRADEIVNNRRRRIRERDDG